MKYKRLLIGVSMVLVVIFLAGLFFVYFRNSELLTKTPAELLLAREGDNAGVDALPDISAPTSDDTNVGSIQPLLADQNFLFPDAIWENAFMLRRKDGALVPMVGLSTIPIGTIINAPMSGYLSASTIIFRDHRGSATQISIDQWPIRPPLFRVAGASLEILVPMGQARIEKGDPWLKIVSNQEVSKQPEGPVVLMISAIPRDEVAEVINETTDPREFIQKAVEKLN